MDWSTMMPDQWLVGLVVLTIMVSLTTLTLSKTKRDAFLTRLHIHRRRLSGASTPPRSFSPSKRTTDAKENQSPVPLEYRRMFPPSRRAVLPKLAECASGADKNVLLMGNGEELSQDALLENPLPTTRAFDLENEALKFTPTGFSTVEIKAMGDFPAYDILSGVPLPKQYPNFDPVKALPRPYRPFRWNYHQTMAHGKLEPDWWLEVENTYVSRIDERKALFRDHGNKILDALPGSELACKELMEMCLQFYCARYPGYFSLSTDKRIFRNGILQEETDVKSMHPLKVLLNNVPEDFAIVLRNETDGIYYFRAGLVCSSLGWNVSTKIGLRLEEIHAPVPDYKEKMSRSMDRYFSKMPTDTPIQRGSWGLEIDTPLFMPAGDPHEQLRSIQKANLTADECFLRVDWQTLRRLPLSAGVVFNFKAIFTPVNEFRDEPYIPALVLRILKDGKKSLMEYKNTWHVEHAVIPALEEFAKEQVELGMVKPDQADGSWGETTLRESPWFPGWEEKWHRQQDF